MTTTTKKKKFCQIVKVTIFVSLRPVRDRRQQQRLKRTTRSKFFTRALIYSRVSRRKYTKAEEKMEEIKNERENGQTKLVTNENQQNMKETLVRSGNSLRANFRKSHTCGSLFAKCACSLPLVTTPTTPTLSNTTTNITTIEQRKKYFQSYSHPDTPFIFTNENKKPPLIESPTIENNSRLFGKSRGATEHTFCSKDGKFEITNSKRLSTPNIGNYSLLNIAVHPEIVLKVSKGLRRQCSDSPSKINFQIDSETSSNGKTATEELTPERRTKSESYSKSCSPDDLIEENFNLINFDVESPIESSPPLPVSPPLNVGYNGLKLTLPLAQTPNQQEQISIRTTISPPDEQIKVANNLEYLKQENKKLESAENFFKESGILGPMGNGSSNLTRKTSKIAMAPEIAVSINLSRLKKSITMINSISSFYLYRIEKIQSHF